MVIEPYQRIVSQSTIKMDKGYYVIITLHLAGLIYGRNPQ